MSPNRICIFIYGMHRSGTSALSGALNAAGISFGQAIAPPSYDNPKGFFENYKIQEFNDFLLQRLGRSWDQSKPFEKGWIDSLKSHRQKAKDLIEQEYSNLFLFAIKDPRMSLLLPFWESVLSELKIGLRHVIMVRHASEISLSLQKRNSFDAIKSDLLIRYYLLHAERNSRDKVRTFTHYDELCSSPYDCVKQLIDQLDLIDDLPKVDKDLIEQAISIELRNHKNRKQPNKGNLPDITALLKDTSSEKNRKSLDDLYEKYLDLEESYHQEVYQMNHKNAKLLMDYGLGYRERDSIKIPIDQETEQLKFELGNTEQKVHQITLSPVLSPCKIKIESIEFDLADVGYELSENADTQEEGVFVFNHEHPRFIINFKSPAFITEIFISIKYIEISGPSEKKEVPKNQLKIKQSKKERLWYQVLKSIFSNPVRLLKNINPQNYRILKSALKRESPQQIIRNFKKLLERKETQQSIKLDFQSVARPQVRSLEHTTDSSSKKTDGPSESNSIVPFRVLYITPELPEYDTSSGGRRAIRYLSLLHQQCEVHIFCLGGKKAKYVTDLKNRGFNLVETANPKSIQKELSYIHVLLYSWYYTFHDAKALTHIYDEAMTIIDSVDVQWVREERSIGILKGLDKKRVAKNKESEIEAYDAVDRVWAVSIPDKEAIREEIQDSKIDIISNIHEPIQTEYVDPLSDNILFIGGYNHYPNLSAVQVLANEIFPKVLEEIPSAQLFIAGSNAPDEIKNLGELKNVQFLGFIPEEELSTLYEKVLLSVSPLLTGAGVKGKITEAMAHMTPVVTNDIGNEGINLIHDSSGLIEENFSKMSSIIVKALRREFDLKAITEAAQLRLVEMANPVATGKLIKKSIHRTIDICIVTWNKLDLLKACIESIFTLTEYPNFNIIVHSNGCTDGTQDYLRLLAQSKENVECILSNENEVFVKPNNKMIKMNPSHDKVLLNNDIEVTKGWLTGLANSAYISPRIGIVGSKVLYFDGRLQEFGSEIYKDGNGRNIGKGDNDPQQTRYKGIKAVGYVSGCAMYIKKNTIKSFKGFSEDFDPCYYEDSDLCYRAWESNIATIVTSDSIVFHHEGATSGVDENTGYKSYQKINKKKFVANHNSKMQDNERKIKKTNMWIKLHLSS